jgi:hypothetical protein
MRACWSAVHTVALEPGGHVTPLAQDTLRERRITVSGRWPDWTSRAWHPSPTSAAWRSVRITRPWR